MIAIDYLQLMEATYAKRQNRQEQISEITDRTISLHPETSYSQEQFDIVLL